jgi:hypothetical protein
MGALIHGAILSVLIFWVVCLAMQYSWNHTSSIRTAALENETSSFPIMDRGSLVHIAEHMSAPTREKQSLSGGSSTKQLSRSRFGLLSLFVGSLPLPAQARKKPQQTPAAQLFGEWLRTFNSGHVDRLRSSYAGHVDLSAKDPQAAESNARTWAEWLSRFGPLQLRRIEHSNPNEIVALAQTQNGYWWRITLRVATDRPSRITKLEEISFGFEEPSLNAMQPAPPVFPPGPPPPAQVVAPVKVSEEVLQSYVGTYVAELPDNLRLSITVEDGRLRVQAFGQAKTAMIPVSSTKFFPVGITNRWIEFSRNKEVPVQQLDIYQSGRHIKAHRQVN